MANRIIFGTVNGLTGYTASSTIDGTNDHFLIQQGSVYTAMTRNIFLGVSGQPMDISTAQNVTNKTLDNTNQATLKSNKFTLQDFTDPTKQALFSVAGVTTGTTRTYTLPNASVTLASLSGTEAFSNKAITASSWSGGTIDNATITVDSISGHTTSTIVTVGGVQMNNGTIATTGAVTTASILAGAVVPNSLTANSGSGWAWQTWAPTVTNLTLGNGTTEYKYVQIGKTIFFRIRVTFGSSSAMGSAPTFSLPVTAFSTYSSADMEVGWGLAVAGGVESTIAAEITSTTAVRPVLVGAAATYLGPRALFAAAVPGTWTTGNFFTLAGSYEAA